MNTPYELRVHHDRMQGVCHDDKIGQKWTLWHENGQNDNTCSL